MFWKKLILINASFLVIILQLISLYLKTFENTEAKIKNLTHVNVEDFNLNISHLIKFNKNFTYKFDELRDRLFFKVFKVNFNSECNFWTQNMICNFHTCTVCQCDENEIPFPWKQEAENDDVDKKIDEKFYQWVEKYNYSSPQWLVENEIDSKQGIYVNLVKNPEAFTGYQGQNIWNAIYYENCFSGPFDQMCSEEKVFYKVISGLHSNINIHLSKNYLDIQKNETFYNYTMIHERVLDFPDRVNNLFFLHSMLIHTFYKAKGLINNFEIYTGNKTEDGNTQNILNEILTMNETEEYYNLGIKHSKNFNKFLKFDKLDQIKLRFRNISSIIDCVSCQKCKLHGKLQIYGLATMLKILFNNDDNLKIKRNEFISFINLIGKVSRSIRYLTEYLEMLKDDTIKFKNIYISIVVILGVFCIFLNLKYLRSREKYDKVYKYKSDEIRKAEKAKQGYDMGKLKDSNIIVEQKKNQ